MAEDWEELAGEKGEKVTSNRWKRMFKLGSMGAKVTVSAMASKLGSYLPGDKEKRAEGLKRSYEQNAQHVVEVLGQLKGASMKIGQMLSADPEVLPGEFSDVLSKLQKDAPPMTYATVKEQIETALDRPMEMVFSYFDPEPVGSASIGQVHRGVLESGEEVAVKVQYPGVKESLESDLKTVKNLLVYGRVVMDKERLDHYFAEVRRMLLEEADYVAEARQMQRFHDVFEQREGLRAPRPYMELTSEQVLVMEYIDGKKLDEALEEMGPGERREKLLERWMHTYSWMFHEHLELHGDPHPGNFLLTDDDTLVMLDFGCVKTFEAEFADGFLDILDAAWQDDWERAIDIYLELGFGTRKTDPDKIDPELFAEYHEIVIAPFMRNEPFDFAEWTPASDANKFMMRHPSFLTLVPPPDAITYFRVLSGIKGLMRKMDAQLNVYEMAYETTKRRGRLTEE